MAIRTTMYLDEKLHARLRQRALDIGTTMSQLVTRYSLRGLAEDAVSDAQQTRPRETESPK